MLPVLLNIGPITITSFGFFATLGFVAAVFVMWRLARVYDVNEGKLTDLAIFTFLGGFLGARLLFVALHLNLFADWNRILLINRYPGLSFWGGLFGGMIVFKLILLKSKLSFWQLADFAGAGLLLALAIGDVGCVLGGCAYGVTSNLPIAIPVAGILAKRLPITLLEALVFLILFSYLWGQVVRFHFTGKIIALALIFLGLVKFVTEFWRGDNLPLYGNLTYGMVFSLLLLISGWVIFYRYSKRSILADLISVGVIFTSVKRRKVLTSQLRKSWYNQKVSWKIRFHSLPKFFKKKLNVRATPEKYR